MKPWVRRGALVAYCGALAVSLVMPGVGLWYEPSMLRILPGSLGIVVFTAAQAGVLHAAVSPWLSHGNRAARQLAFLCAAVVSVPLVGPIGAAGWATWAWLGGSIVGTVPVVLRPGAAVVAAAAAVMTSAGVAWWAGGSPGHYALITLWVGLAVGALTGLPTLLWERRLRA